MFDISLYSLLLSIFLYPLIGIYFEFYPSCVSSLKYISNLSPFSLPSARYIRRSFGAHSIQFDPYNIGDTAMFEIDIRSSTPSKRTMHLFINGVQQKPFAINLPPSICFMTALLNRNDYMTFVE